MQSPKSIAKRAESDESGRRAELRPVGVESAAIADATQAPSDLGGLRLLVETAVRRVVSRKDSEYEDLVQSALESVLGARPRPTDDDYLHRWVAAVARNIAIDRVRARTRERRVFESGAQEGADQTPNPLEAEHLMHVRGQLRRLDSALHKLGPSRGTVVYLHDVLGYELAEIAAATGISVAAAQSRLVRGRHALIREMNRIRDGRGKARDDSKAR